MTKVTIVGRVAGHQNVHAQALQEGLAAIGIPSQRTTTHARVTVGETVACWGWRYGRQYREAGAHVLVMERGYVGDRFAWTSIGWNGLNGRATFPTAPEDGGARFHKHHGHLLKPWRTDGDYVLLIGQVPGDASLRGRDLRPWYAHMARRAREAYGMPVMFRPHPQAYKRGGVFTVPGASMQHGSLQEGLTRAAVVVSYNSNATVDAVLAGVPTIATDEGSMAYEMCAHDIGQPLMRPDRERWAHQLAWKQWTLLEISSGAALQYCQEFAERSAA